MADCEDTVVKDARGDTVPAEVAEAIEVELALTEVVAVGKAFVKEALGDQEEVVLPERELAGVTEKKGVGVPLAEGGGVRVDVAVSVSVAIEDEVDLEVGVGKSTVAVGPAGEGEEEVVKPQEAVPPGAADVGVGRVEMVRAKDAVRSPLGDTKELGVEALLREGEENVEGELEGEFVSVGEGVAMVERLCFEEGDEVEESEGCEVAECEGDEAKDAVEDGEGGGQGETLKLGKGERETEGEGDTVSVPALTLVMVPDMDTVSVMLTLGQAVEDRDGRAGEGETLGEGETPPLPVGGAFVVLAKGEVDDLGVPVETRLRVAWVEVVKLEEPVVTILKVEKAEVEGSEEGEVREDPEVRGEAVARGDVLGEPEAENVSLEVPVPHPRPQGEELAVAQGVGEGDTDTEALKSDDAVALGVPVCRPVDVGEAVDMELQVAAFPMLALTERLPVMVAVVLGEPEAVPSLERDGVWEGEMDTVEVTEFETLEHMEGIAVRLGDLEGVEEEQMLAVKEGSMLEVGEELEAVV